MIARHCNLSNMALRMLIIALFSSSSAAAAAAPFCVSSGDASLTACVDAASGLVASLAPRGAAAWAVNASTQLGGGALPSGPARVSQPGGAGSPVTVSRAWSFAAVPGAPAGAGAVVTDTFSASATSVRWHVSVAGTSAAPWSVPIVTSVGVTGGAAASQAFKLWSPWDRNSGDGWSANRVDPLQPSDVLPGGWWDGTYRLGNQDSDFIVAPLAALLSADPAALDAGVSVSLAPTDVPMDTHLFLQGGAGAFAFQRRHHRISSFAPVELDVDLVGHEADWRASLAWSVAAFPAYWQPANAEVFAACAGTGSYSWYEGTLTQNPSYSAMAYAVNWDLSGRYFPYMGMFVPPVKPGEQWENDPEGSQPRANVTFASIGAWYRTMADAGFTDLSYYNVNEYGLNIVLPPLPPPLPLSAAAAAAPPPLALPTVDADYIARLFARVAPGAGPVTCPVSWPNASACLAEAFPDSVVRRSWDERGRRVVSDAYYSWQDAVVVDPGTESYHAFMLEQLARHIVYEDAFGGMIVDRSDWMDVSSLQRDDGLTFVEEAANATGGGVGASLKVSYNRIITDLRAVLDAGPGALAALRSTLAPELAARLSAGMSGSGIMMMNVLGNARLDQFKPYDGIFAEGSEVNAAGLLGVMSPTILWTYDSNECCRSAEWADTYFQQHLVMGVMPMLPFPGNDHAIGFDAASAAYYVRYGPMMAAVAPKVWALFPHILALVNVSGTTTYAKANAFVVPLGADASDSALLLPVMLGEAPSGTVELNLTAIDRAWPAGSDARESTHPLVRKRAAECAAAAAAAAAASAAAASAAAAAAAAAAPAALAPVPAPAADTYVFEVIWPGSGNIWRALTTWSQPSGVLSVPLQAGAALVRARRISGAH